MMLIFINDVMVIVQNNLFLDVTGVTEEYSLQKGDVCGQLWQSFSNFPTGWCENPLRVRRNGRALIREIMAISVSLS